MKPGFKTFVVAACVECALMTWVPAAQGGGERRGEIGPQVGVRWLDRDFVPAGSDGLDGSWGVEGSWGLGDKWALFGDFNTSTHDSVELCENSDSCSALTPTMTIKVVTFGVERRLKAGPKGGRWLLGVGTGMMDLEWNGIQIHHGILSLNFGRRMVLGPTVVRVTARTETGFSGNTDNQLEGAYGTVHVTNLVLLVGWGFGIGPHL